VEVHFPPQLLALAFVKLFKELGNIRWQVCMHIPRGFDVDLRFLILLNGFWDGNFVIGSHVSDCIPFAKAEESKYPSALCCGRKLAVSKVVLIARPRPSRRYSTLILGRTWNWGFRNVLELISLDTALDVSKVCL
jgi:hypothetical protein